MPGVKIDEQSQELTQMIFRMTKWSSANIQKAMREWVVSERDYKNIKVDPKGRVTLAELSDIGKTQSLVEPIAEENIKLLEKEFKKCGVGSWTVSKHDGVYYVSFLDKKANEVESAMKDYIKGLDSEKTFSLDKLQDKVQEVIKRELKRSKNKSKSKNKEKELTR